MDADVDAHADTETDADTDAGADSQADADRRSQTRIADAHHGGSQSARIWSSLLFLVRQAPTPKKRAAQSGT